MLGPSPFRQELDQSHTVPLMLFGALGKFHPAPNQKGRSSASVCIAMCFGYCPPTEKGGYLASHMLLSGISAA